MDEKQLCSQETVNEWDEAFGRLLDLLPRSKKAIAFPDASFVEVTAKRWARIAIESRVPR